MYLLTECWRFAHRQDSSKSHERLTGICIPATNLWLARSAVSSLPNGSEVQWLDRSRITPNSSFHPIGAPQCSAPTALGKMFACWEMCHDLLNSTPNRPPVRRGLGLPHLGRLLRPTDETAILSRAQRQTDSRLELACRRPNRFPKASHCRRHDLPRRSIGRRFFGASR